MHLFSFTQHKMGMEALDNLSKVSRLIVKTCDLIPSILTLPSILFWHLSCTALFHWNKLNFSHLNLSKTGCKEKRVTQISPIKRGYNEDLIEIQGLGSQELKLAPYADTVAYLCVPSLLPSPFLLWPVPVPSSSFIFLWDLYWLSTAAVWLLLLHWLSPISWDKFYCTISPFWGRPHKWMGCSLVPIRSSHHFWTEVVTGSKTQSLASAWLWHFHLEVGYGSASIRFTDN